MTGFPVTPGAQSAEPSRALKWSGYAVAIWSFAYMLPHLNWALGGRFGLFALVPTAAEIPQFRWINWWASLILTFAALLGAAFARPWNNNWFRWSLLALAWCGASIAVAHGAYGIVVRAGTIIQLVGGEQGGLDPEQHNWLLWDLFLFEPWFLIEGLLWVIAGWHFLVRPADRYRWLAACFVGACIATGAAIAELRVGP